MSSDPEEELIDFMVAKLCEINVHVRTEPRKDGTWDAFVDDDRCFEIYVIGRFDDERTAKAQALMTYLKEPLLLGDG